MQEAVKAWCHYNRHLALLDAGKPSVAQAHCPAFSREIAKELVPLYNTLADADLLARCSSMLTQNANKSFNGLVWKRCPKTVFASLKMVETAAALAALEFNASPQGIECVFEKLSIACGTNNTKNMEQATKDCITGMCKIT